MKLRSRRKPVSDMNVVPYIDVMLVLLIIFMVTAPMLVQGVDVEVPQVSSEALSLVANYVTSVLEANPGLQVLLRADKDVKYGRVMSVMSSLQAAGVDNVGLITEAPNDG